MPEPTIVDRLMTPVGPFDITPAEASATDGFRAGRIIAKGVIKNGQVIVERPIDLPDGTEVAVALSQPEDCDRPMTPEEIAAVLAAMDKIEPFDMMPEEEAAAIAWEKKVNEYTIAKMNKGIEDVFR